MINGKFRPWGQVDWMLKRVQQIGGQWSVIGAISPQQRSCSIFECASSALTVDRVFLLNLEEKESAYSTSTNSKKEENAGRLRQTLSGATSLTEYKAGLFDPIGRLKRAIETFIEQHQGNVHLILDITCVPEKIMFPVVRWLKENTRVNSLLVSYMQAESYTSEELAFDPEDWAPLQTFIQSDRVGAGMSTSRHVVIGAGFLPFSLPEMLKKTFEDPRIRKTVFLPFPSTPANTRRAWEFVRRIEDGVTLDEDQQIMRVGLYDLSGCADRIYGLTDQGTARAVFVPYGPKTHSLAMCLHAIAFDSEVYFTQPTFYNPNYTVGICRNVQGKPEGYLYAIRINATDYY
jgi:hypothetical protein